MAKGKEVCKKHPFEVLKRRKDGKGKYCPYCVSKGRSTGEQRDMKTSRNKFLKRRHIKWTPEGLNQGKVKCSKKAKRR